MPLTVSEVILGIFNTLIDVWSKVWWIFLPVALAIIFYDFWLNYIRFIYVNSFKWINLRVRVPKEVLRTPKAMEQVFSAAQGTYSFGFRLAEIYWDGKVEDWTSFELTADVRGISFYIRTQEMYRSMYESAVYSQYPDAEIDVVDDYTNNFPNVLPNKTYEVWGGDFVLSKREHGPDGKKGEDGYPIRTYKYWETTGGAGGVSVLEEKVDTMSFVLESMSRLREGEYVWLQIMIRPADNKWKENAEKKVIAKITGRKEKKKKNFFQKFPHFISHLIIRPFRPEYAWFEEEKEAPKPALGTLTPGEQDAVKAIEEKISKIAFETAIRLVYIARRDVFSTNTVKAVGTLFRQFNTNNLNGLRFYKPNLTIARPPFKSSKLYFKKRRLYDFYRWRKYPNKKLFSVLNIEELATLYHYPSAVVEAPLVKRIEAKKGEPPPELPMELE